MMCLLDRTSCLLVEARSWKKSSGCWNVDETDVFFASKTWRRLVTGNLVRRVWSCNVIGNKDRSKAADRDTAALRNSCFLHIVRIVIIRRIRSVLTLTRNATQSKTSGLQHQIQPSKKSLGFKRRISILGASDDAWRRLCLSSNLCNGVNYIVVPFYFDSVTSSVKDWQSNLLVLVREHRTLGLFGVFPTLSHWETVRRYQLPNGSSRSCHFLSVSFSS